MRAYRVHFSTGIAPFTILADDDTVMFDRISRLADVKDKNLWPMRAPQYSVTITPLGETV